MFAWNYCVELFARIHKKASGAYLMRRPRPFCVDQTAEIGGVVCSCALRSRALRISIARCNNCSNSQRSIRGPVSQTFELCVTTTELCFSVGRLQCSKFTKHPLQKNCRTLSSAQESEIVSRFRRYRPGTAPAELLGRPWAGLPNCGASFLNVRYGHIRLLLEACGESGIAHVVVGKRKIAQPLRDGN
jgi:hypothetical protein